MDVTAWQWRKHVSKISGKEMLTCTYYGDLSDKPVTEYLAILHHGYAGRKAIQQLFTMARDSGFSLTANETLDDLVDMFSQNNPPKIINYKMDGKFHRIIQRKWE